MDSAGVVDEKRAGCVPAVWPTSVFNHILLRSGQLLRCEPVSAHKLMEIEKNVLLPAADITTPAAGRLSLSFFLRIPDSDGDAGIRDRVSVKEAGEPWFFIIGEVGQRERPADFCCPILLSGILRYRGIKGRTCSEQ
jgi:hypothetical protein